MKYLTLIPDYTGSCIQDDYTGPINLEGLGLSLVLIQKILTWHEAYRKIIPLSDELRITMRSEIERLDLEGLSLAEKISGEILGGAKVRYYSEGKYKYL